MRRLIGCVAFLLLIARAPAGAYATATPPGIHEVIRERVADVPGVGMIVGVIERGNAQIYSAGSTGNAAALDEHTLFEIGSVSKTFTATILASMVLDGSVKLDDPVAMYLPHDVRVPSRNGKQITLLDLATQHSGLPRMPSNMDYADPSDPYADYTLANLYKFLDTYTLTRDPGQSYEYSNLGVGLLGDALAARSGISYAELLQRRVLAPLGMNETGITLTAAEKARFAVGHDGDGDAVKSWAFQALAPAGAIRSSVADMLKYVRCNLGSGPLARACLFAQQPRSTIPGNHIGLVWWTGNYVPIVHHGGDTAGYHSAVAMSPDHSFGVVALTNGGLPVDDLAMHLIDSALPVDNWPAVAKLDDATLASYVGVYDMKLIGGTFVVTKTGATLFGRLLGQQATRIYPITADKFYLRAADATLDFSRGAGGTISQVVLHQNVHNVVGLKLNDQQAAAVLAATPAPSPTAIAIAPAALDEYVGTYLVTAGATFTVTRDGNQLMVQFTGQPAAPVYPSAKDQFFTKVDDAQISFLRDAAGKISALELHQNGQIISAALVNGPLPVPSFSPEVSLDAATLAQYVGTYIAGAGAALTVTLSGTRLMVQLTGQPAEPVYASAKDEFFYKIVDAQITFVRDANGNVTQLILHQNGRDLPATKT